MALTGSYTPMLIAAFLAIIFSPYLELKHLLNTSTKQSLGYSVDSLLNFTELTSKYGYTSEEHTIVTADGYVLRIFRIAKGRSCKGFKSPPVLVMHGLLLSSDAFLDAGPNAGLAYLLSDACHDLWLGNQRGNYYSRRHTTLDPDRDPQFWDFTVDEIGLHDIPATIDYVLEATGSEKLNYVGYSQGSGSFFIMCSELPGYCDKVNVLINLAPAARQTNTKSVTYRTSTKAIDKFHNILRSVGLNEVLSKGAPGQEAAAFLCNFPNYFCRLLIDVFDSVHPGSITSETKRVMYGHFPAGTSLKNMARYGQSMTSRYFEKFDYGARMNMKVYGDTRPPRYNLSAVTTPTVIVYGKNDHLVDPKDIKWLVQSLPDVREVHQVADPLWNHFDVVYSQHTRTLIFPIVNDYLMKYSTIGKSDSCGK